MKFDPEKESIYDAINRNAYGGRDGVPHDEYSFTSDLFVYFGVLDNSKRHVAYGIAYEHGHACGFYGVACYFEELLPLFT